MTTSTSPTERVGRYQLLEPIGIGPSGTVSRAKVFGVAGFERQFAVKRFHGELTATAAMAAMLSAAARAYGSLEHPRIARMSEFGVAQGATFTAVEYVPGLDALRLIAEARLAGASGSGLATGGALALVSQAARAVGYAHGRGLTHLGLAPSNVIVTADGDVKITDFGILSATLPQRPIDVPRLAQRIPYLAPEQLANEATSAATDVFALGVLAYELVTGTRTFKGDTPQQVASSIMNGAPVEPPLPRPIVRVLQRCLARSPFERFPDARALADALDAALRVAPVPGTRKDIGAQVKETLDRLAALNEGQMSGMVALHLGTGPIRRLDEDPRTTMPGMPASAPYELGPADPGAGLGNAGLGNAANTLSDLPRPMTTVPGLPPPPIPVPPGIAPPSIPTTPGAGSGTLLGMGKTPPPVLPAKPRPAAMGSLPPVPPGARPPARPDIDTSLPLEPPPTTTASRASTESAVHTLDPSDLLSIDAMPDELGDGAPDAPSDRAGDGGDVDDLAGQTMATPASDDDDDRAGSDPDEDEPEISVASNGVDDGGDLAPRDGLPAAASADDFGEAPTHALSNRAAAARMAATPATSYRLDPSSIDTAPIPPVTLEPLLFDPIENPDQGPHDRPTQRPIDRPTPRPEPARKPPVLDEDRWFEDSTSGRKPEGEPAPSAPGSGRIAAAAGPGAPGSGRVSSPMSASASSATRMRTGPSPSPMSPTSGQTILGFAAPSSRATPAAPFPPAPTLPPEQTLAPERAPEDELPVPALPPETKPTAEPSADQLSEMMLEGFHTGPGPVALEVPIWPQEPSAIVHSPAPPLPPVPPGMLPLDPALAPEMLPPEPGLPAPGWMAAPPPGAPTASPHGMPGMPGMHAGPGGRRPLWILVGMLGAAVIAVGAWQLYVRAIAPPGMRQVETTPRVHAPPPTAVATTETPPAAAPAAAPTVDAGQVAAALPTAGHAPAGPAAKPTAPTAPADAGAPADAARVVAATSPTSPPSGPAATPPPGATRVTAPPGPAPGPGDNLSIASTPPGARVFLDGADAGVTPLKLAGSPDHHNLALLLAGHELYVAQVDGHGTFQIPLKEVTPINGPAGIKVMHCKEKERYYVFVDGKPTGQTCPSERIGCEMGPHTVEVYDVVSETRRKWDIVVKETRLSFRVRVDN